MYKQIGSNVRLTWALMTLFLVLIVALGWVFARAYNAPIILAAAVAIAIVQALTSYYYSDKIALIGAGAKEAPRKEFIELHRVVENIAIAAGVPKPKIYVINDPMPNAFATGRDPRHAALAVTTGLLEKLKKVELEGVVSHEMSHVGNYDIRLMTVVVVLVGVVALISDWALRMSFWRGRDDNNQGGAIFLLLALLLAILAPISATLIQLAVSRRREYLADATGALITRYPEGLASALEKISKDSSQTRLKNRAINHLFIADPAHSDTRSPAQAKRESWLAVAFSTHPPIGERVRRLREMLIK